MITLDTNVWVRVLIGDDPTQTRRAEQLFHTHTAGEGIFIPSIVLAEIAWVLSSGYGLSRSIIHERLSKLVRTRGVFVENIELTLAALVRYSAGGAEFADQLILGRAIQEQALPVFTFDRKLAREDHVQAVRA